MEIRTTAGYRLFITLKVDSNRWDSIKKESEIAVDSVVGAGGDVKKVELQEDGIIFLHVDASDLNHQKGIISALQTLENVEVHAYRWGRSYPQWWKN